MKTNSTFGINFWAGIIGNSLECYDSAVFSLLAPFIAPIFFPTTDPITALILTYAMLPLGNLARPFGSLLFGKLGDQHGRKKALSLSIFGLAIVTGLMGCLPTFAQVGFLAPLLMVFGRVLQNVFIGGESAGGAIFILEHANDSKHSLLSSLYGSSTIIGITMASTTITLLSVYGDMQSLWRIPFWIGFLTALGGIFIRSRAKEPMCLNSHSKHLPILATLKKHWKPLLAVIGMAGYSSANYMLAMILPNGFLPKVANINATETMAINSILLVADMAMLPLFGLLAEKLTPRKSLLFALLTSLTLCIPLYAAFENANWMQIIVIRSILVCLGVWFSAPLHAWMQTLVPVESRYLILSLGYSLGVQLIGAPAISISLLLYRETSWVCAPGLYWFASAIFAGVSIYLQPMSKQEEILALAIASKEARVSDSL